MMISLSEHSKVNSYSLSKIYTYQETRIKEGRKEGRKEGTDMNQWYAW